jgi:DNA-binding NtrC family response regulator
MGFHLLIVDDDPLVLTTLQVCLQRTLPDAVISTAPSADEALFRLRSPDPVDIVLADVCMPGMDGIALLREIKARLPLCAVFLMTGVAPGVRMEAFRLGASSFIKKPPDIQRLGTLLSRAVEHAHLLSALHDRNS